MSINKSQALAAATLVVRQLDHQMVKAHMLRLYGCNTWNRLVTQEVIEFTKFLTAFLPQDHDTPCCCNDLKCRIKHYETNS